MSGLRKSARDGASLSAQHTSFFPLKSRTTDIVRYSDRQKKRELAGTVSKQWDTDWEFPSELKLKGAMKSRQDSVVSSCMIPLSIFFPTVDHLACIVSATHVSFALGDASKQLKVGAVKSR